MSGTYVKLGAVISAVLALAVGLVGAASAAGFDALPWNGSSASSSSSERMTAEQAEVQARVFAADQLARANAQSQPGDKLPNGAGLDQASFKGSPIDVSQMQTVDAKWIAPGTTEFGSTFVPAPMGDERVTVDGGWLFVFRLEGVSVPAWKTDNATLQVDVLMAADGGKVYASGSDLR